MDFLDVYSRSGNKFKINLKEYYLLCALERHYLEPTLFDQVLEMYDWSLNWNKEEHITHVKFHAAKHAMFSQAPCENTQSYDSSESTDDTELIIEPFDSFSE